ncbi:2595_t:CDS:2, partial [Scutellospora calospora]
TDTGAVIMSNKIYYYGGWDSSILYDIFYVDISNPFNNASNLPFTLQTNLEQRGGYSAVVYKSLIVIFGGYNLSRNINDLMIIDETSSSPSVRTILSANDQNANSWPTPRKWMTAVIDSKAKMYVWGGTQSSRPDYQTSDGTMYILDVTNYSWVSKTLPTQPIGRQKNTATLLPDGRIVMIGGIFNPDISQLDIYDTIASQWSRQKATILARWSHTATLATDGKSIIIFGGVSNNTNATNGIAVLNITNYVWTSVFPSGNPPIQYPNSHTAALYDDYIFFAFGIVGANFINTVSILDISNNQYKWVDSFMPRGQNCIIEGGDIVGPKIRVAIYAQCLTMAFKLFVKKQWIVFISVLFGLVTSSVLVITAILQHIYNNLHYVFQIEVTYLSSALLGTIYYAISSLFLLPKRKPVIAIALLATLVILMMTCYSIWIWTTIKWNLSNQ